MATVAWCVDELLSKRGWTSRQLADAAALDRKTVRNIVAGRATRVDLDTLGKLAAVLDVHPGALFRSVPDQAGAWVATAGAGGRADAREVEALLGGRWVDPDDPALERAGRSA